MLTVVCAQCGNEFEGKTKRATYCSQACRQRVAATRRAAGYYACQTCGADISPRAKRCQSCDYEQRPRSSRWTPCEGCGRLMVGAMCNECRRAATLVRLGTCPDCGGRKDHGAQRCRPCSHVVRRVRPDDDRRLLRQQRERAAAGLTPTQRSALLHRWIIRGTRCAYCEALAETIDHVIPLVRGGDNFEGNLAPCCKACNSSKAARLVIEWRTRKRPSRTTSPARRSHPLPPVRIAAIVAQPVPLFSICAGCGAEHSRSSNYCSARCSARSAYRLKVGIPLLAKPYEGWRGKVA